MGRTRLVPVTGLTWGMHAYASSLTVTTSKPCCDWSALVLPWNEIGNISNGRPSLTSKGTGVSEFYSQLEAHPDDST